MKDSLGENDKNMGRSRNIVNRFAGIDRIETLAAVIESRGGESGEHVRKISSITRYLLINSPLGEIFTPDEVEYITVGAKLHDIGKLMIPSVILNKPEKLTEEEFEIMKTHTLLGAELLRKIPNLNGQPGFSFAYDIVRYHHERWDGQGYPDGLKGKEIPLWVQIVSLVDAYDALVVSRIYKEAIRYEKAIQMIAAGECGIFNPDLLVTFFDMEWKLRKFYKLQ